MKIIWIKDGSGRYQSVPVDDDFHAEWVRLNTESQRAFRREAYHRSFTPLEEADLYGLSGRAPEPDDILIRRELESRVREAILQLTPTQRRRVLMYMDGLSYSEIARREGVRFSPCYKSLHLAFKKLRMLLRDCEDDGTF